jgi:hypothetical protein
MQRRSLETAMVWCVVPSHRPPVYGETEISNLLRSSGESRENR